MAGPQRTLNILMLVFGLIGAVLLSVSGYLFLADRSYVAGALRADGVVVELVYGSGRGARPRVEFTVDGRTVDFVGSVSSSPPAFSVGERVVVLYPPGRPEQAFVDSFLERHFATFLTALLGTIFGGIGAVFLLVRVIGSRRRARLLTLGTPVKAKVVAIEMDATISVGNRHPWRIKAEFQDRASRETLSFLSHRVWDNPAKAYPPGSEVTVYHIPSEPGKSAFVLEKMEGPAPADWGPRRV